MAEKIFKTRIKQRRDTSANWESKNPVLLNGEVIIVDTANGETRTKTGNGTKTYTQLPFDDEGTKGGKSLIDFDIVDALTMEQGVLATLNGFTAKVGEIVAESGDVRATGFGADGEVVQHSLINKADRTDIISKRGSNFSSNLFNDLDDNLAGAKVFTITAVNDKEITVDLSSLTTEELSTFNSIQAGARCCVDTSTEQDNIKIVSVDGTNGKIVVENTVSALAVEDGTIDGDPVHRNYILILDYPNLGNTYDKTINAHAEGENTQALARGTHSEGRDSKAIGQYAHSEGLGTMAGYGSHSEGRYTKALGNMSHAEGHLTNAYGHNSHSEGRDTTATGYASHAEGNMTEASGAHAHSEGIKTKATGESSHAEGSVTEASGKYSHSEGKDTIAQGDYSHAEGIGTKAIEKYSHAEGANVQATGEMSHAEGGSTVAEGRISHAEGNYSTAKGNTSHAEGISTSANGAYSHAEGNNTKANGEASHAEGKQTEAGLQAHAEGDQTKATGETAHAEGRLTEASGASSHAEGKNTKATGYRAHAEGMNTKATSESAHSEGIDTEASGRASHSEGTGTVANGENQHTQGKYNVKDTENKYAHIIGNGTSDTARSNAHTVDWDGNAWFAGDIEGVKDGATHKLSEKMDRNELVSSSTTFVSDSSWFSTYDVELQELYIYGYSGNGELHYENNDSDGGSGDITFTITENFDENTTVNLVEKLRNKGVPHNSNTQISFIATVSTGFYVKTKKLVEPVIVDSMKEISNKLSVVNNSKYTKTPWIVIEGNDIRCDAEDAYMLSPDGLEIGCQAGNYPPRVQDVIVNRNVEQSDGSYKVETHKLTEKVDKVSGESLIDKGFADAVKYNIINGDSNTGMITMHHLTVTNEASISNISAQSVNVEGTVMCNATKADGTSTMHSLSNKAEAKIYTVSVPTTSWTEKTDTDNPKYYYKKITVSGMTASGQAMTDVAMSDSVATARKEMEAYQCINRVVTGNDYVDLYCFEEIPTTTFTLRILVISNVLS